MKTATYKGKKYLVKFEGKTKFGMKAKLAFMDGSKEFWVDLSACTITSGGFDSGSGSRFGVCGDCGRRSKLFSEGMCWDCSDHS